MSVGFRIVKCSTKRCNLLSSIFCFIFPPKNAYIAVGLLAEMHVRHMGLCLLGYFDRHTFNLTY